MTALLTAIDARGVARIALNRPQIHNAFDDALIAELTAAFTELGEAPQVRVVVLAAVGKSFSAGADLGWMRRMAEAGTDENVADAKRLGLMLRAIERCPRPTVAVVQGAALGGGVGLVAACDIAIAADTALFALSEVRLGLVPAMIGPHVVASIGERACRRLFLTAERFSAGAAFRLGLVHDVVEPDRLEFAVEAVVADLLAGGPEAQAAAKVLIRDLVGQPRDEALLDLAAAAIAGRRASAEGQEGMAAFFAKRRPDWAG